MTYYVWEVDTELNRIRMVKELSNNKKSLKGKWQIFVREKYKDSLEWEAFGYRLGKRDNDDLLFEYAVFDSRNELAYKNKPKDK